MRLYKQKYQSIKRGLMGDLLGGRKNGDGTPCVRRGHVETPCMASLQQPHRTVQQQWMEQQQPHRAPYRRHAWCLMMNKTGKREYYRRDASRLYRMNGIS